MSNAVASVTGGQIHNHNTPLDLYDQLVAAFGEQSSNGTRWVSFGAGATVLTFFPDERAAADRLSDDFYRAHRDILGLSR